MADLRLHSLGAQPRSTSVHNFCPAYFLVDEAFTTATTVCIPVVVKNIAGAVRERGADPPTGKGAGGVRRPLGGGQHSDGLGHDLAAITHSEDLHSRSYGL